ncbi:hypothetical protein SKAU_G00314950 [Synaphobranchus kaupii]|uniref:Uncharacterized protein n=1 Tax=Synaphobranchus kaupii TaxID=118154 RepID=A0A9Q1ESE1_SYNKA|nr:hypothetical protein SKAU_G00314950 [Synaphobranchus kaupii]
MQWFNGIVETGTDFPANPSYNGALHVKRNKVWPDSLRTALLSFGLRTIAIPIIVAKEILGRHYAAYDLRTWFTAFLHLIISSGLISAFPPGLAPCPPPLRLLCANPAESGAAPWPHTPFGPLIHKSLA